MESIEKLREWSHSYDNEWIQEDGSIVLTTNTHGACYGENYGDAIRKMIDAVEREVDEKYMPLPLDMNGETIRIGDTVRELGDRVPMKVMSLTFYEDCVDVNTCGMNPNLLMHVEPRTVEDVLRELIADTRKERIVGSKVSDEQIAKYADELRKLGGDV